MSDMRNGIWLQLKRTTEEKERRSGLAKSPKDSV